MVVALNPGKPTQDERGLWEDWGLVTEGACSRAQAGQLLERCTRNYLEPEPGSDTVFHRKAVGLARAALWLFGRRDLDDESWLDEVWFTDAFKCSTIDERGPRIPARAMGACRRHLQAEIDHFEPRVVLTLGGRARAAVADLARLPTVVGFRFPSGGLAAIDDGSLDEKLDEIAVAAGLRWGPVPREAFAAFRRELRSNLFP